MQLIAHLAINALALWVVDYVLPGFSFESTQALLATSIIFGVVNTFLRPVLQIVALPITLVTFGVAAFLINVLLLWLVSIVVPGFTIASFITALIASILLSFVSWFLHRLVQ